ncbi:hypothetical protein ACVCNR_21610 (plasmid) [Aquamicrobium terrae]
MRTIIVPDIIRVGQTDDNVIGFDLIIEDRAGHFFALQMDMEACRALRQAVSDLERKLADKEKPASPAEEEPTA